ncbi:MAG: GntR family transcriptional regulator [Ruminococcaceae bacterium]|nr:GntR family transcriptional regulator [Oscillospiraceae bacterium]
MDWKLNKNKPLVQQICEQICLKIATGEFAPESKLPSIRETAILSGVNPNTVQRAFEMLEQEGIIYSVRGSGSFVSPDIAKAKGTVELILRQKALEFFAEMQALGLDTEQTKKYVEELEL